MTARIRSYFLIYCAASPKGNEHRSNPALSKAAYGLRLPFARRTTRLDSIVHHLGLALGGRPAASLARRLLIPVSKDTLLRTVRRRFGSAQLRPTIIVIDDWAWKRGSGMARSSAIWNVGALSIYFLIAASPPWKRSSCPGLRSASSRVIAVGLPACGRTLLTRRSSDCRSLAFDGSD